MLYLMLDRGLFLTWLAVRRQLAAMPHDAYLIRLIHHATHRAFPGERLWTAGQLASVPILRFLRIRNREGCDIYVRPWADDRNAGYILLDLDGADGTVLETMRAHGHEPCVVLQTSPGHFQAWLHISRSPLPPALATAVGKQLARTYGGDLASTDWGHLGRLAGFTNHKPHYRTPSGYPPWVKILHACQGMASRADGLLRSASGSSPSEQSTPEAIACQGAAVPGPVTPVEATEIYQSWIRRWHIAERFPQTDWSIVDLWIARQLLSYGMSAPQVEAVLQFGSPGFPRRHASPQDYLRRTLARAAFPRPAPPV